MKRVAPIVAMVFLTGAVARAQVTIRLAPDMHPKSASALSRELKLDATGTVHGDVVTFDKLLPDTPYDLAITLTDGRVLQGADLSWLDDEPTNPDAGPITDDDRAEMRKILTGVKSFYNHSDILLLRGDHDRATGLVQLVRDREFYNDKGGEIIWRVELYYFKFQYGGWEIVQQANKVLRRERFTHRDAYQHATDTLRWTPELGGVRVTKDQPRVTINLAAKPATQPTAPDDSD